MSTHSGPRLPHLVALAIVLVPFATAQGASVIPQSTESLARQATHVVRAVVEDQREGYDERARHATIETRLSVEETLKGRAPSTILVRQLRGIPGDARFRAGEEVVVFLRVGTDAHQGAFFLLAMAQGKYEVTRTSGGATVVQRDLSELAFVSKDGTVTPAPADAALELDELRSRVRSTLGGRR